MDINERKLMKTLTANNSVVRRNKKLTLNNIARKVMLVLLVSLMTINILGVNLINNSKTVYADDLVNTVPNEETPTGNNFYSNTINTGFGTDGPYGEVSSTPYGPPHGPQTVDGVLQSQSVASATSFAAGLPLGTIFIDQSKIGEDSGTTNIVANDAEIIYGLSVVNGIMSYDGTKTGAKKMVPGTINKLDGNLFTVTFDNAAILPNGDLADLVITYSNARIVVDERYLEAPAGEQYYHGAVYLAKGNAITYGGSDTTDMSTVSYSNAAMGRVNTTVSNYYGSTYATKTNPKNPVVGLSIDASYQILNKNKTPVDGTYVFAICGINLDRDPGRGSANNVAKPLWYSYNDTFEGGAGKEYSFFSEAMEINGGKVSDYIYVRPNNALEDNTEKITGYKGEFYYPNVSKIKGTYEATAATDQPTSVTKTTDKCDNLPVYIDASGNSYVLVDNAYHKVISNDSYKFIGNQTASPDLGGNDNSYNSGFVTLADAATGFKVTATGHGSNDAGMNSFVFNSKQIWYRYKSGSGKHGKIETTSEGNWGGKLSDGGNVLDGGDNPDASDATGTEKPNVYVVAEGKTVTYTMTPDIGYKMKKLTVNNHPVSFNGENVNKMKKGDSVTVTTAAGKDGVLTYNGDGSYTFIFPYAENDEEIFVEWEPTSADILVSKIWDDENDKDGMRKLLYSDPNTIPKFKLEYSINGGKTWNEVKSNSIANTTINPVRDYNNLGTNPIDIPSGEDTSGKYLDGTYVLNRGTNGSYSQTPAQMPFDPDRFTLVPGTTCHRYLVFEYNGSDSNDPNNGKKYVLIDGNYYELLTADVLPKTGTHAGSNASPQPSTVDPTLAPNMVPYIVDGVHKKSNNKLVYQDTNDDELYVLNAAINNYRIVTAVAPNPTTNPNGGSVASSNANPQPKLENLILHKVGGVQQMCRNKLVLQDTTTNTLYVANSTSYRVVETLDIIFAEGSSNPDPETNFDIDATYIAGFEQTRDTCDSKPVLLDPRTGKRYVQKDGNYHEVIDTDHPFTWDYLPIYTYDASGTADRLITYRIVELSDPVVKDEYENAKYFDAQAFELTSETSKSWDGWMIYENTNNPNEHYVLKGDGLYYEVSIDNTDKDKDGIVSDKPAKPQPNENDLDTIPSNTYRTADKAIPYHEVQAKNTHITTDLDIEVIKKWNDAELLNLDPSPKDGNAYQRENIKIVLHGETEGGFVVDLNGNADGKDLIKDITTNEDDAKANVTGDKLIDGYKVYEDISTPSNQYAYVENNPTYADGYYAVSGDTIDYSTIKNPSGNLQIVKKGDGTYIINDNEYGSLFEDLPTHFNGKEIVYTVTETDKDNNPVSKWIMTGGVLNPVKNTEDVTVGYKTTITNTPDIEDKYSKLALTLHKIDTNTKGALKDAEFTVYKNAVTGVEAEESTSKLIGAKTIFSYTDDKNVTTNYILHNGKYYIVNGTTVESNPANPQPNKLDLVESGKLGGEIGYSDGNRTYVKRHNEYHLVNDGVVDDEALNPQPDENLIKELKDENTGDVVDKVVITDENGDATINFLKTGTYYIKETKAPEGYNLDESKIYVVNVDAELMQIILKESDDEHPSNWWQRLWDLLFGNGTGEPTPTNWAPATDKKGGTLTIENSPIVADILVRKYWNDNDNQDGKRPGDKDNPTSTTDTKLPTVTLQYTIGAHTAEGYVVYTDGNTTNEKKYIHKPADDKYYEVIEEDSIGSYEDSAANPQPATASLNGERCNGLDVYVNENIKYVIIDNYYHVVNYADKVGKIADNPAETQPDPNLLNLVKDGNWINAYETYDLIPQGYEQPRVSYVGGPVLTHQNDAYTWTNLPAYMNGKVVTYRIYEEGSILNDHTYDIESNHTSQTHEKTFNLVNNSGSKPTGLNQTVDVTNKHETQVVNIEIYKEWEDEDIDDRSPATLYLYKVVEDIEYPVTAIDQSGRTYEDTGIVPVQVTPGQAIKVWKDLPTYEGGKPVTYRIKEEKIDGYITIYEAIYTPANKDSEETFETINIKAEDIKRTFYQQGDALPEGKKVGNENTTARFEILNERSVNIDVKKTWVNGANANVTFELWRTTKPESALTTSKLNKSNIDPEDPNVYYVHKTIIISVNDFNSLSDAAEKAKYSRKYVRNDNENDIITPEAWAKLDNTAQEAYEKKYQLNGENTFISETEYNALSDKGKNSYTKLDYYINNIDATPISEADYNLLPNDEKANYSWAYEENGNTSNIISEITYNTLSNLGKNNYTVKYVNETNPANILDEADWLALPNPEQAKYTEKYVDDRHAIISKDTYEALDATEKAKYDIEASTSWSPYKNGGKDAPSYVLISDEAVEIAKDVYDTLTQNDKRLYKPNPAEIADNWELVDSHIFDMNDFIAPSDTGDFDSWTFNDLLIKDTHGNKYYYRILEKPALLRFRENQISDTEIINNNVNVSDGNVSLEVVKEVENRQWLDNDQFYFYLEPVKGIDISDPNNPVDVAKNKVPMPYRIDPNTTKATFDNTADAIKNDLQVGAIGRAATFKDIQYKENSALYHSIDRGDIVEFYYKVYEVYNTKNETSGNDTIVTVDKTLDEATNHTGYKKGITYAGKVNNLTAAQHNAIPNKTKENYIPTNAYEKINSDPLEIISVAAYNALDDANKVNYKLVNAYVNINDANDLINKDAYKALADVAKNAYTSQNGYVKGDKAITKEEYDKLKPEEQEGYTSATIYSAFIPEVHIAKVIVKNVDGIITTETQWDKDGEFKTGAVPVYTNRYSSEGYAKAWIEKKIANRSWQDYNKDPITGKETGDAFSFKVESISGAQLNVTGASSDSYTSKPLMSNTNNNPQADIQKMSDTEYAFGLRGNKYDNTMLNADGYAYFIYELSETPSVTHKDDHFDIQGYTVDGLEYDTNGTEPRKIYARLKATDNWDGTISFEVDYFSDASCKDPYKIDDHKAWIYDDDTETEAGKRLLSLVEIKELKEGTMDPEISKNCREVNVAYFVNYQSDDIPVIKQWVGGPAIEDVNLHLVEHLFPISGTHAIDESIITDAYIKQEEQRVGEKAFWQTAGYTHIAERGEFLNNNGNPIYDEGSDDTSSRRYENIEGFNKDLRQYIVKDGITYRVVYRLLEDDSSDTYTRSYKSINIITVDKYNTLSGDGKQGYESKYVHNENNKIISKEDYDKLTDEEKAKYTNKYVKETAGDYIYSDGDILVVINTVVANNTANIAAVKQLLNRNWLDSDDFKFILTPVAKYDAQGNKVNAPDIPMPISDDYVNINNDKDIISKGKYETLDDEGKDSYDIATTTYVNNNDPSITYDQDGFDALDPDEKLNYTEVHTYVNKKDNTKVIDQDAYDLLKDISKDSYKAKETSNEAHAKKGETTVDPNGNLERLAKFNQIKFKTSDLVYNETDKHYHGDFFYELREDIPVNEVYAVDKVTLQKVLVNNQKVSFDESIRENYHWRDDKSGITYDGSVHKVHIQVKENRTNELQVQVAYDETTEGKINTGSQFTPVYTNRYDATLEYEIKVDKYIMGRDWVAYDATNKTGDAFDFRMTAMSGAPFEDANMSEFPAVDTQSDDDRENDLEAGDAIHSARGAHVKRLFVTDINKDVQSMTMPKIIFRLSELNKVTNATDQANPEKQIKYSNGDPVPAGVAYGQFIYSFEETNDYLKQVNRESKDLIIDPDTEYIRVTVIDKRDGTLDYYTEVFEDRYCTKVRYVPGSDTEKAKNPTFVNQLKRELSITKTWTEPATSDVVLRLQWSYDEEHWYYVDEAEWLPAGIRNSQTIKKGAFGKDLTVTWHNLPAYANITDRYDQEGDDLAMNDIWIYYRIVEDDIKKVETRYSKDIYIANDTPDMAGKYYKKDDANAPHTGKEKEIISYDTVTYVGNENPKDEAWYIKVNEEYELTTDTTVDTSKTYYKANEVYVTNRVKQLYVTNWPEDIKGEAKVGVVKQYIGKEWENEIFTFEITPIESMIGSERNPVKEGEIRKVTNYKNTEDNTIITEAEYYSITDNVEKAKYEPIEVEETNKLPEYNKTNGNKANATKGTDKVSVNERSANFDPLTIKLSQLAIDYSGTPDTNKNYGKAVGTFFYRVKEVIPSGATVVVEGEDPNTKTYYVKDDKNGNKIKYTTDEHIVKIVAVDDGSGAIDITTSFDNRGYGEFVPVYTNYAMMPTPITGEKEWIGGTDAEHINGTVETQGNDIVNATDELVLKLQRKLENSNDAPTIIEKDDAGRNLVIVWARIETTTTENYINYAFSSDGQNIDDPVVDIKNADEIQDNEKCNGTNDNCYLAYQKETITTKSYNKYENGNGHYTIMAKDTADNKYYDPILNKVNADGSKYVYSIKETNVPTKYSANEEGLKITNTNVVKDSIKVTKTWDDASNAEGYRPDNVMVHLYKVVNDIALTDEEKVDAEALAGDLSDYNTKWIYNGQEFDNYDNAKAAADADQQVHSTIVELSAQEQFDKAKQAKVDEALANKINNNSPVLVEVVRKEIKHVDTDTSDDIWDTGIIWEDLPIYDKNGDIIKYIVIEGNVSGYTTTYSLENGEYKFEGDDALQIKLDGYAGPQVIDIKNKLTPKSTSINITKIWDDNDNIANKRPTDGLKIALYQRIWNETAGKYGSEEEAKYADGQIVPVISLDGIKDAGDGNIKEIDPTDSNTWNAIFGELPSTMNGKTIIYSVKELTDLTGDSYGYEAPVIIGNQFDGFTITNKRIQELRNLTVQKVWDDKDNQDALRPDEIIIKLYRTVDKNVAPEEVTGVTLTLNEDNNWKDTFYDLYASDFNKQEYIYSVDENEFTNYASYTKSIEYPDKNNAIITNRYNPEELSIKATKIWDEESENNAGVGSALRKDVNLHLYGYYEDNQIGYIGEIKTISKDATGNDLTVTWNNLPKKLNGKELIWNVYEDAIPGYNTIINKNGNVFEITNTFAQSIVPASTTSLTVKKVWEDNNNQDNIRPSSITLQLLQSIDGSAYELVEGSDKVVDSFVGDVSEEVVWDNLPHTRTVDTMGPNPNYDETEAASNPNYDVPKEIVVSTEEKAILYLVREKDVPTGYTSQVINDDGKYIVYNRHTPETIDIPVTKIWNDNNNETMKRPDYIEITLSDGENSYDDLVRDPWNYTFTNLPKYKEGKEIVYTLSEKAISNYTTAIAGNNSGFIITNSIVEEAKMNVIAKKVWNHGNNTSPADSTTFTLFINGEEGESKEINAETSLVEWSGLEKTDTNGNQIVYDVKEKEVDHYTMSSTREVSADGNTITITITNTYKQETYPLVTYIDPLAEISNMIMKSTHYRDSEAAAYEANKKIDKPNDPSHVGYEFVGWDVDLDPESGYVLVAKYITIKKAVTFIDPEADNPIIKSELAGDTGSVEKPNDPNHPNRIFKGWIEAYDADGNVVYIAQYEYICPDAPECKPSGSCICPACPSGPGRVVPNTSTIH